MQATHSLVLTVVVLYLALSLFFIESILNKEEAKTRLKK